MGIHPTIELTVQVKKYQTTELIINEKPFTAIACEHCGGINLRSDSWYDEDLGEIDVIECMDPTCMGTALASAWNNRVSFDSDSVDLNDIAVHNGVVSTIEVEETPGADDGFGLYLEKTGEPVKPGQTAEIVRGVYANRGELLRVGVIIPPSEEYPEGLIKTNIDSVGIPSCQLFSPSVIGAAFRKPGRFYGTTEDTLKIPFNKKGASA